MDINQTPQKEIVAINEMEVKPPVQKKNDKPFTKKTKVNFTRSSSIKNFEESSKFLSKPHIRYREINVSGKTDRKTVFVGSSELCHLWKSQKFNPLPCVDFDCLIGGTVIEVHKLFLNVYRNQELPLNIILSCGLNNIPLFSSEQTICQLKCLAYSIKSIHKEHKIVFVSIPYAPKFCHSRRLDHIKMTSRIKHINEWIETFNLSETCLALDLSKFGVESYLDIDGKIKHVSEDWKEVDTKKKLHFSLKIKDKVAVNFTKLCNNFEKLNLKIDQNTSEEEISTSKNKFILKEEKKRRLKTFQTPQMLILLNQVK